MTTRMKLLYLCSTAICLIAYAFVDSHWIFMFMPGFTVGYLACDTWYVLVGREEKS